MLRPVARRSILPPPFASTRFSLPPFRSLPDDQADCIAVDGDGGVRLNLYRLRRRPAGGPVILFGHACGFAAGSYRPLFDTLAEDAEILAYDSRGHGGSDVPAPETGAYGPDRFALDLAALAGAAIRLAEGRPLYFVGHSLNAAAMLRLGAHHGETLRRLGLRGVLLFEPPVFPTEDRPEHAECAEKDARLVARTRNRRARFADPQELIALLTGRGLFRHLSEAFLAAHATATLRPLADGGYTLACPPVVEAETFATFGEGSTFAHLGAFPAEVPVHLVGGDPNGGPDRNWTTLMAPALAERLGAGRAPAVLRRFTALPERGHLMVQEDPATTRRLIRELLVNS